MSPSPTTCVTSSSSTWAYGSWRNRSWPTTPSTSTSLSGTCTHLSLRSPSQTSWRRPTSDDADLGSLTRALIGAGMLDPDDLLSELCDQWRVESRRALASITAELRFIQERQIQSNHDRLIAESLEVEGVRWQAPK